jgi:hypothetical protein
MYRSSATFHRTAVMGCFSVIFIVCYVGVYHRQLEIMEENFLPPFYLFSLE